MRSKTKRARFLHEEARSYKGHPRVRDFKKRARRIDRRTQRKEQDEATRESANVRLATIPGYTGDTVLDLDESDAWDEPMVHVHQPRFPSAPYDASIPAKAILEAANEIRAHRRRVRVAASGGPYPGTCACGMPNVENDLYDRCGSCRRGTEKSS